MCLFVTCRSKTTLLSLEQIFYGGQVTAQKWPNTTFEKMPDTAIHNMNCLEHCKQKTAESLDEPHSLFTLSKLDHQTFVYIYMPSLYSYIHMWRIFILPKKIIKLHNCILLATASIRLKKLYILTNYGKINLK